MWMHVSCINIVLTFCLDTNRNVKSDKRDNSQKTNTKWIKSNGISIWIVYEQEMVWWSFFSVIVQRTHQQNNYITSLHRFNILYQQSRSHEQWALYPLLLWRWFVKSSAKLIFFYLFRGITATSLCVICYLFYLNFESHEKRE